MLCISFSFHDSPTDWWTRELVNENYLPIVSKDEPTFVNYLDNNAHIYKVSQLLLSCLPACLPAWLQCSKWSTRSGVWCFRYKFSEIYWFLSISRCLSLSHKWGGEGLVIRGHGRHLFRGWNGERRLMSKSLNLTEKWGYANFFFSEVVVLPTLLLPPRFEPCLSVFPSVCVYVRLLIIEHSAEINFSSFVRPCKI